MEWTAQRKSDAKAEDKGEPEEAAAEIEAGGRRKEIADDNMVSTIRRDLFCFYLYFTVIFSFAFASGASAVNSLTEQYT